MKLASFFTPQQFHHPLLIPIPPPKTTTSPRNTTAQHHRDDAGIPSDLVRTLATFTSRHNHITVLEVSRAAVPHPLAGARLLLLDSPGNIHSLSFPYRPPHSYLTSTYFDVFATLPPILPAPVLSVLGFGAGSSARLILRIYPSVELHGWELDSAVVSVAREYFELSLLEKQYPDRLFIYIGNALNAEVENGFSGILVDLFSKGRVIPELQDPVTWRKLRGRLRKGGRVMVNVGGSCVEPEDKKKDGRVIMEETLKALSEAFDGEVSVLSLGNRKDDSTIAMTGKLPEVEMWKKGVPKGLRFYVDMWRPYT